MDLPRSRYVHIPYCRRRCRYCDFAIVPIGDSRKRTNDWQSGFEALNRNYTQSLLREISALRRVAPSETSHAPRAPQPANNITLHSLYFGGGTPSLAPVSTIQAILDAIFGTNDRRDESTRFVAAPDMEVTMEMDPGTFDRDQLIALRQLGINRISLGVQSFSDVVLQRLGRQHTAQDVWDSIQLLQSAFENDSLNYSIDLITGLPGVSLAEWAETLYTATNVLSPRPKHISVYDLQVEEGTVFGRWYPEHNIETGDNTNARSRSVAAANWRNTNRGGSNDAASVPPPLPSDEEAAFQYQFTAGYLRAKGFEHYEVSSYAQIPEEGSNTSTGSWRSRHNQVYWGYSTQWYAVGLGATSYVQSQLVARPRTMFDYSSWVEQQALSCSRVEGEPQTKLDRVMYVALKRLRTAEGLDLKWTEEQFGRDYVLAILKGASLGLELGLAVKEGSSIRLVDSKGFLFSNTIISSIFAELEDVA